MKSKRHPFFRPSTLAAATLAFAASSAFAQTLLLSDNFNTAGLGPAAFNDSAALTADQSGTAATKDYNVSVGGGWDGAFQRGNGGNMHMFAGAGNFGSTNMAASLNYDIAAAANTANSPLEIKFNMSVSDWDGNVVADWTSFTIGTQNPWLIGTNVGFSSLFRDGGGTQQFTNGDDLGEVPYSNPGPSFTDGQLITFVLSDAAGTGSAFNSDGATDVVKMYVDGTLTNTFTGLDLDATDQYISFNAQHTVANINNLAITALSVVADPFADWMSTNYPDIEAPDNAPTADPDNDSIDNLVEYILQGGDPSVSTTGILPTLDASGTDFVFTYYRRAAATGTTQTFEYGSTLSGWTPVAIPGGAGVTVSDQGGGIDKVEIIVAKDAKTQLFGRLQVVN